MSRAWAADVRLVAEREVRERLRSKSFRVMTAVTVVVLSGLIVLSSARRSQHPSYRVGIVDPPAGGLADDLAFAASFGSARVVPVPIGDIPTARALVESRQLTLAVVGGTNIVVRSPIEKGDTGHRARFVAALSQRLGVDASLRHAGLSAGAARQVLTAGPATVEALKPTSVSGSRRAVAMGGLIVLFVLLQQYGQWVVLGIVEEKTSRVIEVLLSTVRARRLLSGKIVGMGIVAILQAATITITALAVSSASGNGSVLSAVSVTILPTAGWCILGYLFYCSLFATAGAMAARTEDAQNSAFPLIIVMFIGYFAAFSGLTGGDPTPLLRLLAYVPPTAPFCMPVLVLVHGATWWQAGLAAAGTVVSAVLLMRLAGRVYVASINRTRSRTRLRDLRSVLAA